jgi:hypothetical protein
VKILPDIRKCGDYHKNPQGKTLKDGKRNGYLCIFIFFMGKIVFEFLIYWIIDEMELGIITG